MKNVIKIKTWSGVVRLEVNVIQWCPDLVYPDLADCRDLVDKMPAAELGHISPLFRFSGLFSGPFYT